MRGFLNYFFFLDFLVYFSVALVTTVFFVATVVFPEVLEELETLVVVFSFLV